MNDITAGEVRVMLNRTGLSQAEAAAMLDVEVRTVGRWAQGTLTPSGEPYRPSAERWGQLVKLCRQQDAAAEQAMSEIRRHIADQSEGGGTLEAVHLRLAADDADARRLGLPTRSAHVALLRRVAERCEAAGIRYMIVSDEDEAAVVAGAAHHQRTGRTRR